MVNNKQNFSPSIKLKGNIGVIAHPLDQFKIVPFLTLPGGKTLASITVFFWWILLILHLVLYSAIWKEYTKLQAIVGAVKNIVTNILKENLPLKNQPYFAIIFFLFLNILACNLVGLLPFAYTITSSFIVTAQFSMMHFFGINLIGIQLSGWDIITLFLPGDSPLWIAIFLVAIEAVSYIARVLSLSIRLFANMMSGHALLKILNGFTSRLSSTVPGVAILPWLIVSVIFILELLISFLQAFVFVVLVAIYLYDVHFVH